MNRTRDALGSVVEVERSAREDPAFQPLVAAEAVFVGLESFWLGSIVGQLIARGANASDIRDYVRAPADGLPLYGCERGLLDTLIAAVRTRGYDDDTIVELIDAMISVLGGGER